MRPDDLIAKAINRAAAGIALRVTRGNSVTIPAEYKGRGPGGKSWVLFPGADEPTPVRRMSVEAEVGDVVSATVGEGRVVVDSNISNPSAGVQGVLMLRRETENVLLTTEMQRTIVEGYLEANKAVIDELVAGNATITGNLTAAQADIDDLHVRALTADSAEIADLKAQDVEVSGKLTAASAEIGRLKADTADIDVLRANSAKVKDLEAEELEATVGYIEDLTSKNVRTEDLAAINADFGTVKANAAKVGNLTARELEADHAAIANLDANYASIDLANVNNAWIRNGVIDKGAILDANVFDLTGNKATISQLNAANINVINLHTRNLTVDTADGFVTIGTSRTPTKEYLDSLAADLQSQIDGTIETFTVTAAPTMSNYPTSTWAVADYPQHVGDIAYVTNQSSPDNGHGYRFSRAQDGTYSWQLIQDSDVTRALQELAEMRGDISEIESFDVDVATFMTDTDEELSSLKARTTSVETGLGTKVESSTFNQVAQTVDSNSSNIRQISTTTTSLSERMTQAESSIDQALDSISLMATKTEVWDGLGVTYDHSFTESGGAYTFTAHAYKGSEEVTDRYDPLFFTWWLRTEDGVSSLGSGLTVTVDAEDAGLRGSVIGGLEDSIGAYLVDDRSNHIVTESGDRIAMEIIWEV